MIPSRGGKGAEMDKCFVIFKVYTARGVHCTAINLAAWE